MAKGSKKQQDISAKMNKEKKAKDKKVEEKKTPEKKGFIEKFRIFCHGVASEFQKVHWPTKENMLKYSIATIAFIIFCGLFFYLIDIIFAFIQSLF